MSKLGKTLVALAALLIAALLLNPSAERHRTEIKASIADRSPLAGLLGFGALTAFASNYHSVGIASYTSIQGHTISVGMLGMVFVLEQHDL
jgi:hypothetical protein